MAITIRAVSDLDSDWTKVFDLLSELDRHHQSLLGGRLSPNREKAARKRWGKPFKKGRIRILLAEAGDEAVGLAVGHTLKNPSIFEEKVGMLSTLFIREKYRGPLLWELHEQMLAWFREQEVDVIQGAVMVANEDAMQVSRAFGYKPYMEGVQRAP